MQETEWRALHRTAAAAFGLTHAAGTRVGLHGDVRQS